MNNERIIDTSIPPKLIERNEFGLVKGVNYSYDESGFINWRTVIPQEFLYLNPGKKEQLEKKYNKTYNEINIVEDKVEDKDLCILLGGIRFLANLIGYKSINYVIGQSTPDYCSATCTIVFKGNYSTNNEDRAHSDSASATLNNTASFYRNYLVEAATNRAFCRTVRGYCNLSIVSKEELSEKNIAPDDQPTESSSIKPIETLKGILKQKNRTFDELRAKLVKDGMKDAEEWKSIDDIPKIKIFDIITILNSPKKPT